MCVGKYIRDILRYCRSKLDSLRYAGCDTVIVAGLHYRVLAWLHQGLGYKLCDFVLCIVIVLMKEGTEERLKEITIDVVLVRSMLEEYTHMFQHSGGVLIGFVACSL